MTIATGLIDIANQIPFLTPTTPLGGITVLAQEDGFWDGFRRGFCAASWFC